MDRVRLERLLLILSLIIPYALAFQVLSMEIYFLSMILISLFLILERKGVYFPRFVINSVGLLVIITFFLTVNLSNFLENILRTLFLLLNLKLLERKKLRDLFQIYLLEFLIFAGLSYFYTAFWFFILLLGQIILISYALFLHFYLEEGEVKLISKLELKYISLSLGSLLLLTLFFSSLFFLGLPRLHSPLFNILTKEDKKAQTGFTDKINLGAVSEIQESSKIILRFTLEKGNLTDPNSLYIKVMTYDYFDGKTWHKKITIAETDKKILSIRELSKATIYLEESLENYLPVPDYTFIVSGKINIKGFIDGTYRVEKVSSYPLRYEVYFSEKMSLGKGINLEAYLQVPEVSTSIKELAQRLRGKSPEETLQNILTYFLRENFRYSLKELPLGETPLEKFLFETKRGNCEYFAGATALLLRMNGVPARLVGGFKGTIYQKRGNYYLVLEKFAHAWVEAYMGGSWVRIEPSPASTFFEFQKEKGVLQKLRLYIDIINFYYTRFILDYDLKTQKEIFSFLGRSFSQVFQRSEQKGQEKTSLPALFRKDLIFLVILLIFGMLIFKYRKTLTFIGNYLSCPEVRIYLDFERELNKRGYRRAAWEGVFDLVEKVREPGLKEIAKGFAETYSFYYYQEKAFDRKGLEELKFWLRKLKNLN